MLSILISSIPERFEKANQLIKKFEGQINGSEQVEILCLMDNRIRSIGEKREELKNLAKGRYWAFCDDDDDISEDYVLLLLNAIRMNADVITFDQITTLNLHKFKVSFGLNNPIEQAQMIDGKYIDIKRPAWHVCAWKASVVKDCHFPFLNYDEDTGFVEQALNKARTETHIDKVLHYYNFDSELSRADNG